MVAGNRVSVQHGDIKPGNLLVCEGDIKVGDFGLASTLAGVLAAHQRAATLAYAAPEVFLGQLSRWTDHYALAVSYCELRTAFCPLPVRLRVLPWAMQGQRPTCPCCPLRSGKSLAAAQPDPPGSLAHLWQNVY